LNRHSFARASRSSGKSLPQRPAVRVRLAARRGLARFLLTAAANLRATPATCRQETVHMSERLFGIHGAALTLRSQRMGVIASNIANAATPGFKARDIDFNAALDARLARQRGGAFASAAAPMVYRRPTMPSLDGNTVELNQEQVAFAENAVAYSATLSFVQGRVSTITRALKGE
jgi:flagellar basal-body rod protein FlgB